MIGGLIVAAGRSSRMGRNKALLHLGGRPIIDRLLDVYFEGRLDPVVVVAQGDTIRTLLDREESTSEARRRQIELVRGDPETEMIESIARGIELMEGCGAVVIQPVDAPFTSVEMLHALADGNPTVCRVLCHEGRAGHPVLVPRSAFSRIMERPQGGLRAVLAEHEVELVEWFDRRVLADVDTPEELDRWRIASESALH